VLTVPASLAGLPAISVTAGNNNKNLPIGMQIIGKPFEEISVLAAGSAIESSKEEK
jgi:aspartyl-tRNA(Asn)/glutamyl-tRNA(Gln) amidotransferase subunit A